MYKIIGADQKEYGPIAAEQLRQWVTEGRANAQTLVLAEGQTEWKPLSAFPEFADLQSTPVSVILPSPGGGSSQVPAEVILGRDYELNIGSCISRSWELVKQHFWPIVGISLLVMVVMGVFNQIIGLLSGPALNRMILERHVSPHGIALILLTSILGTPLYMVLMAGLFKYYLKLIRGEPATVGDAFCGFTSSAGQLILLGLVTGLLSWLGYILCVLPGLYLSVSWLFALPLTIDRRLGFWEAMELSRRVVAKHWFIVFALLLVTGLLAGCGVIACCIGVLVTMPLASVALMYAYEDIFSRQAP